MEAGSQGKANIDEIASKPNKAAIVLAIGDVGELSFKDLKAKMNLGVGTLYYHLDGLRGVVAQNALKQYVLTDEGKIVYEKMKGMEGVGKPAPRGKMPSVRDLLGEIFLFDSHVERLAIDSMSNLSIALGILLTGGALAGASGFYDLIFFSGKLAQPVVDLVTFPLSWALLFCLAAVLMSALWRTKFSLLGLAGGTAVSLVPVIFSMVLEAVRKTFSHSLDFLGYLYVFPYYPVFQGLLVVWAAYILAVSVRSASDLNLEKALVVVLLVVIVNLGFVWARPWILPAH
jgi:hypothetical protein